MATPWCADRSERELLQERPILDGVRSMRGPKLGRRKWGKLWRIVEVGQAAALWHQMEEHERR
eukprot:4767211-Prorocentrum_lima.AAC.1